MQTTDKPPCLWAPVPPRISSSKKILRNQRSPGLSHFLLFKINVNLTGDHFGPRVQNTQKYLKSLNKILFAFKYDSNRTKKEAMVSGELKWAVITNTFSKFQEKLK